jgi:hypothetical protein
MENARRFPGECCRKLQTVEYVTGGVPRPVAPRRPVAACLGEGSLATRAPPSILPSRFGIETRELLGGAQMALRPVAARAGMLVRELRHLGRARGRSAGPPFPALSPAQRAGGINYHCCASHMLPGNDAGVSPNAPVGIPKANEQRRQGWREGHNEGGPPGERERGDDGAEVCPLLIPRGGQYKWNKGGCTIRSAGGLHGARGR